jgi:8-oxo-dGTP diphosphatase
MAAGDGNGWVDCRCGARHWGRHGAAGLLLLDTSARVARVLLQLRAGWTHEGGSWSLVGGARDSHEDEVGAALREAAEEAAVPIGSVRVLGSVAGVDHVDWRYTYVIALTEQPVSAMVMTAESDELRWVAVPEASAMPLHRGLGDAWPRLAPLIDRVLLTGQL